MNKSLSLHSEIVPKIQTCVERCKAVKPYSRDLHRSKDITY